MLDKILKRLGEALQTEASRDVFARRLKRWKNGFAYLLTSLYLIGLLAAGLGARWIGEHSLAVAFFLYLPWQGLLLPLLLLFPLTLLLHWRLALLQIFGSILFIQFGMGWQWGSSAALPRAERPEAGSVTVLTYNRGQHMSQSLRPFLHAMDPDLVVLQEAPGRAQGYLEAEGYEAFPHAVSEGEHTLLSAYPILSQSTVAFTLDLDSEAGKEPPEAKPERLAARFEIDFEGQAIAVYSVHFPTPRDTLLYYRRGAALYGVLGIPGTSWGQKRVENQKFWDDRIALMEAFLEHLRKEPLPHLVVGDFNTPSRGWLHAQIKDDLLDAHEEAGHGFGYTFPGITRNPLSRGGPWMRIDYLFADPDWEVLACVTEPDRPSQHRAVAATFYLPEAAGASPHKPRPIGWGPGDFAPEPFHTTGHAGPHPAVEPSDGHRGAVANSQGRPKP